MQIKVMRRRRLNKKRVKRDLTEREIRGLEDRIDLRDHKQLILRLDTNPEEFIQRDEFRKRIGLK